MSDNYRNQDAQGVHHDESNLMGCLTEVLGESVVELEDIPFPRPGTYKVTILEIVEDNNNKCARLRCNIDEGPDDLKGRNFVTTLWFNTEGAIKWSFRTVLRAMTGNRFSKGKFGNAHIIKLMHDMKNVQFMFQRIRKVGKTQVFHNDAFISLTEWATIKASSVNQRTSAISGPAVAETQVDQIAMSLATKPTVDPGV